MNLAELLVASARRVPFSVALASGNQPIATFRSLAQQVAGRAHTLTKQHGIGPGHRVAIYAENSPDYLEYLLAIWWTGATAIPMSAMLHPREVVALLLDSRSSLCLVSTIKANELASELVPCPVLECREVSVADHTDPPRVMESFDPAWIFYTSGTTGTPKGAVLTHGNLMAMTFAYLSDVEPLDERSGLLHLALMSHAGGLFSLPFIARGGRQVVPESCTADPAETWSLLADQSALSLFAPPVLLRRLVNAPEADPSAAEQMGTVLVGAAPVLVNDLVTGVEVFGPRIWNGYGQGETPCTITALDARSIGSAVATSDLDLLRSVGYPRIGTEVRVVDNDARTCPDGEPGEITVRGPTVMSGYWERPTATAEAIRDGWLHTGDIGVFHNGALTLLDRSKDLVITGGANVYPREVEDVLLSYETVTDVAVIGMPDDEWGERVVAFIVPSTAGNISEAELDAYCIANIARYKRPKEYHQVSTLPRNGAGKVLKNELRATLTDSIASQIKEQP
jgi:long-chain acyl-CoA synthetase